MKPETDNQKIATFLSNNKSFKQKFDAMTKEEQHLAIKILKTLVCK